MKQECTFLKNDNFEKKSLSCGVLYRIGNIRILYMRGTSANVGAIPASDRPSQDISGMGSTQQNGSWSISALLIKTDGSIGKDVIGSSFTVLPTYATLVWAVD